MIYKLKSLKKAKVENYYASDGVYPSEAECENPIYCNGRIRFISENIFGSIVADVADMSDVFGVDGLQSYSRYARFSEEEFKHVFGWAAEFEITEEKNPEYFL